MNKLELRIPPVILGLVLALLMWLASRMMPALAFDFAWHLHIGIAVAALGIFIAVAGVRAFRAAHTTVNPTTPEASSAVVVCGIYRRTRNPMYLGFFLALAGWAVYLANITAVLFLPVFVLYMNRFQILPEERALETKFGDSYRDYRQKVRRWL